MPISRFVVTQHNFCRLDETFLVSLPECAQTVRHHWMRPNGLCLQRCAQLLNCARVFLLASAYKVGLGRLVATTDLVSSGIQVTRNAHTMPDHQSRA